MSSPEAAIVRFVLKLVWFLLRLVIFGLTGEWVGKNPFASDEAEPSSTPAPKAAPAAKGKRPSSQEAARLSAWVVSAEQRVNELRRQMRAAQGAGVIEQAIARDIAPMLNELKAAISSGAPPKRTVERIQALDDALNVLGASVQARAEKRAASLADSEAIAAALLEPMLEHAENEGLSLKKRTFLALPQRDPARAQRVFAHTSLLFVNDAMGDANRLGTLTRSVARSLVDDLPELTSELSSEYGLPPGQLVATGGYDPDSARGALGPWLPELFTDVFATFMLGPPYVRLLSAWLSKPKSPLETRLAYAQGRFLSADPPAALRMFAATRALEVLGFTQHAETIAHTFEAAHGTLDALYYPLGESRVQGIPAEFVLDELGQVLDALCTEPRDALGDVTLLDVPGFAFLHGEEARASDAAASLLRGEASRHAVRECASGALAAALARPDLNDSVFAALARSVRGAGTLQAIGTRAPAILPASPALAPSTLRAAFRDRRELRAAMMLSAALGRRPGVRR
jgi:hypothetical protein